MARKISEIAVEISKDWQRINLHAAPYLYAMAMLESVDDMFGMDSAPSVIRYFLGNATTWRGDVARRIKQELNAMVKGVY